MQCSGEIHRPKRIASNYDKEIRRIRVKYRNAGSPSNSVNEIIHNFKKETKETIKPDGCLKKEKYLLWDFHIICEGET